MKITNIKIRKMITDNKLKAIVSVTFDDLFAVHDIKIIQGLERTFVAMPSRKDDFGNFRDIAHPINIEFRQYIEDAILNEYENFDKTGIQNFDNEITEQE